MLLPTDEAGFINLTGPKPNSSNLYFKNTVQLGELLTAVLQKKFSEVNTSTLHSSLLENTFHITLCFSTLTMHQNHLNKKLKAEMMFKSKKDSKSQATRRKEYLLFTLKFELKTAGPESMFVFTGLRQHRCP